MFMKTSTPLRIDFVSDVVCPWCAIGLASLEKAFARLKDEIEVDIHFQPFELNPNAPPEGENVVEQLQKKYGLSTEQVHENQEVIRQRDAELGFEFNWDRRQVTWNTFDAHRLLHWAGIEGKQSALKHALLRANFTDGRNVSDREVLVEIAKDVGLPEEQARNVMRSDAYADEVREAEKFFQLNGITGVPAIIINQRHLISGGQPPEVFEKALSDIASGKEA
jgi:predicted DsbA family dithiol-disulfide isomerase